MLDIKYIRENVEEVRKNLIDRGVNVDLDALLKADEERLEVLRRVELQRQERNQVAEAMKSATPDARPALIQKGKDLKEALVKDETALEALETTWKDLLLKIPNKTHPDAPIGATDADNKQIKVVGEIKKLSKPLSHVELGEKYDLIDFTRAAKVAGAKFYYLKGKLAQLEQAMTLWAINELVKEGYQPFTTPDLAKDEVIVGTGFSPRGSETQIYSVENSDLSLVGTAEITLGGYLKDEIIEEDKLPFKMAGISHCFRTEAGTYGRESYGLYRVHQFTKVEMFVFATPEQSNAVHEELRRIEEMLFTKLGIPFRVVDICTGDLGGPAYRKYDLEAWMWGRGEGSGDWGEVTSTSNCTDYQARRLNIRVKRKDGSLEYVHTLNGTAISLARAIIALLENNQQEDGTITIPDVLRPYCGFDKIG